jgi:hypothetical protein
VSGFAPSFRAEVRDLSRHPLTWAGVVAIAFAAWVFGAHSPLRDNGYVIFEAALQPSSRLAGFFLMGLASLALAGMRTRGTVRFVLPRPMSRAAIVLGKAAAILVLAIVFLSVAVGMSWLVASAHGFGDVVVQAEDDGGFNIVEEEEIAPEFTATAMRGRTAAAALLVLPALLTAAYIGLLVSAVLPSAAGAVIVSVALVLPMQYLPEVIGLNESTARFLPVRAASDFLVQVSHFGRHLATAEWPDYGAGPLAGALVAVVGLPCLAALLFSRLDITE